MSSETIEVHLLRGAVQQYAWGKVGSSSAVANLCAKSDPEFEVHEDQPYAELWMGAHVKAPSLVVKTSESLLDFINKNPSVLGKKVQSEFGSLPFLFKVLSVAKSLSIQAHPNKAMAEKLHSERPDIYRDPNHKPEMAIALTQFEALCGFRPVHEIVKFLDAVPELEAVVGKNAADALRASSTTGNESVSVALKTSFANVILCEKSKREENLTKLVSRATKMKRDGKDISSIHGELFLRVHSQFPADVGCFVIYFLNHILLSPGEAIFLAANVPHAYLSGDCIECMACSDNVVRAGLTPKLVDAATLCEILEYLPTPAADRKFKPMSTSNSCELLYNPPVKDFAVARVQLPPHQQSYDFQPVESASIVLFVSAKATIKNMDLELQPGSIVFIPAGVGLHLSNNESELIAYKATCVL